MDTNKRPESMERITTPQLAEAFIEEQIEAIKKQVGDKKVLLALSGLCARKSWTFAQRRAGAGCFCFPRSDERKSGVCGCCR